LDVRRLSGGGSLGGHGSRGGLCGGVCGSGSVGSGMPGTLTLTPLVTWLWHAYCLIGAPNDSVICGVTCSVAGGMLCEAFDGNIRELFLINTNRVESRLNFSLSQKASKSKRGGPRGDLTLRAWGQPTR